MQTQKDFAPVSRIVRTMVDMNEAKSIFNHHIDVMERLGRLESKQKEIKAKHEQGIQKPKEDEAGREACTDTDWNMLNVMFIFCDIFERIQKTRAALLTEMNRYVKWVEKANGMQVLSDTLIGRKTGMTKFLEKPLRKRMEHR